MKYSQLQGEMYQKIKAVYHMDRIIRALNDEEALYETNWLSECVEDGATDDYAEFIFDCMSDGKEFCYYYKEYDFIYKCFKRIVKAYAEYGIVIDDLCLYESSAVKRIVPDIEFISYTIRG